MQQLDFRVEYILLYIHNYKSTFTPRVYTQHSWCAYTIKCVYLPVLYFSREVAVGQGEPS